MRLIKASEVGAYLYCRRAWWLEQVCGLVPAKRERREMGRRLHARHGRQVWLSRALLVCSLVLLATAFLVLL